MKVRWLYFIVLVFLAVGRLSPQPAVVAGQSPVQPAGKAQVVFELSHNQSPPLRDLPSLGFNSIQSEDALRLPLAKNLVALPAAPANQGAPLMAPSGLQAGSMPLPLLHFEGIPRISAVVPSDANGDVGPNHYVQWVNLSLAIWDKTGQLLVGPVAGNTLWTGFGGACEQRNDGDPIVLYDPLADRWLVSQFSVPVAGPFVQCVAVSATPDPTGVWNRYAFAWSLTKMNDYPKLGVWPDGYYMSVNQFDTANQWAGAGVAVLERERMLQNLPARMIQFDLLAANPNFGGLLPADLDGRQAPPPGAANLFAEWDDGSVFGGSDALRLWEFHTDWNIPENSTFGIQLQPNQVIATANVEPRLNLVNWISQPGSAPKLDAISDRLMYRLQYRNFGDHQTLVSNHTVDAGNLQAGIHWFELHQTGSAEWSLYQEGLHAPDSRQRWMGSAALDGNGNLALGYSLSGTDIFPSIAYAGRLATDPLNALPQGEMLMQAGAGVQGGATRWGDYSMLAVDPNDECTFWYTQQYIAITGYANWRTQIGAFRFPGCSQAATGLLQGTVRSGGQALSGVQVSAGGNTGYTGADGTYSMLLPVGRVEVTAALFGYQAQTVAATIVQGGTTPLDFDLTALPMVLQTGTVSDGAGHPGLPLYARIDLAGVPASPIFTDPLTGQFQVSLPQNQTFTFDVSPVRGGYLPQSRMAASGPRQDFSLAVDPAACPLGYQPQPGACQVVAGGLVVGWVRDANQPPNPAPRPLVGAVVTDLTNDVTAIASADPAGLYFLFGAAGSHTLTAAYPRYLAPPAQNVLIPANGTVAANFDLLAGYLQVLPASLTATVDRLAPLAQVDLQISNLGSAPARYQVSEFTGTVPDVRISGPFAPAGRRLSPKRTGDLSAEKIYEYNPPVAGAWLSAGRLLGSWFSGTLAPWGVAPAADETVWVGTAAVNGGVQGFHPTGNSVGLPLETGWNGIFAADLAYDPVRRQLWQVNAGGDDCIYALDLQNGPTGERICPPVGSSQRGLAYDPRSQTFYSGSWNDALLLHYDRAGKLLDSVNLGINLAGLAFHPGSGHLFALSNAAAGYDVYVFDARHSYALLGGFDLPGMTDYGQAGLELAGDGSLWAVDAKAHRVLQVASGEGPLNIPEDLSWINTSPAAALVPAGGQQVVHVTLNGSGLAIGQHLAFLSITTDTPYDGTANAVAAIPVILTVAPVHTLELIPASQTGWVRAGFPYTYSITVRNTGDLPEVYLVGLGAHTWPSAAVTQVGPVAVGGEALVQVTVSPPPGAAPGQAETLPVTVTPQEAPQAQRLASLETRAAWLVFQPALRHCGGTLCPLQSPLYLSPR